MTSLFVWCMSGVHVYLMVKCALVTSLFMWCATCGCRLTERALMTSLLKWCMSSVSQLFNHTNVHDKSACNKEDPPHIIRKILLV